MTTTNVIPQEDEKQHRRAISAWTMYDWANSTFATTIMAAVFPVYYATLGAAGDSESTVFCPRRMALTMRTSPMPMP
jgi:MFS-type transporter involved in bile tolerance (Atg22 family)